MKQPIPNPEVLVGGEFVTIDTLASRPTPKSAPALGPAEPVEVKKEEDEMLPTEVIHEGDEPEEAATATPTPPVRVPGMAPKREDVLP